MQVEDIDFGPNFPDVAADGLSVGDNHCCAWWTPGTFGCWGNGGDGKLGTGDIENLGSVQGWSANLEPVPVGVIAVHSVSPPALAFSFGTFYIYKFSHMYYNLHSKKCSSTDFFLSYVKNT